MPASDWAPDTELRGFIAKTLRFPPDYDGEVTATLVRQEPLLDAPRRAVLYLHGFIDYFFQAHVALTFNERGYDFYALDLRKYGRSLTPKHPNFCKDFHEYFPEISASLEIMADEGHREVTVIAHSTGALAAALYAKEGTHRAHNTRIIFNSPFLDFKESWLVTRMAAMLGAALPFAPKSNPVCKWYGISLHSTAKGEWDFNTRFKPLDGFDVYLGWIRAVVKAQNRIGGGLGLTQRILVLHSDRSLSCDHHWREEFHRADLILDPADMVRLSPRLGHDVTMVKIEGGKHDLTLSQPEVGERVLRSMLGWLP